MFDYLRGQIASIGEQELTLDVQGVGYRLQGSTRTLQRLKLLPSAEEHKIWIFSVLREQSHELYGFYDREERLCFERLIAISGVGPKSALALLSRLSPQEIAHAVEREETSLLSSAPGIGKKTAERLLLELKGKLPRSFSEESSLLPDSWRDALMALRNLGYSERAARQALQKAEEEGGSSLSIDDLLARALKLTHA